MKGHQILFRLILSLYYTGIAALELPRSSDSSIDLAAGDVDFMGFPAHAFSPTAEPIRQNVPPLFSISFALRSARADAIRPIRQRDVSMDAEVDNHFRLSDKAMNMARLMVLRIRDEQDISETERCHIQL